MNTNTDCAQPPDGQPPRPSRTYMAVKRVLDLILSFTALIVCALPMALISLLIRADSPGKAVFRQTRIGRNGKPFSCYKFRTMRNDAPHHRSKKELENADEYITRVGRFLRAFSLDELPQLCNIVRGEMSFIGPRPLIPEETEVHELRTEYGVYQLRPGISGYAQINGRDLISDRRKAELDRDYLENFSLWTDIKILFGTVGNVICKKDMHQGAVDENDEAPKE
jgi:O-antigen biosynthesis protein WbqP